MTARSLTTKKPLSEWERAITTDHPFGRLFGPCSDTVTDSRASEEFIDLRGFFDSDRGSVFLDQWSHLTEEANRAIAELISGWLVERLRVGSDEL